MTTIKAQLDTAIKQLTHADSPWAVEPIEINGVSYFHYPKAPKTLIELLAPGREHGDAEFIIYQDERLSYRQFFEQADALAWQLQQLGLQKGERVALAMRNYPEWMIAFTAIAYAGGVIVPLNSWGKAEELEYGLRDSGVSFAFFDQQRFDYISDKLDDFALKAIVARPKQTLTESVYDFSELVRAGSGKTAGPFEVDTDDLALIMYTAGTTGEPKGAMASHRNVCQAIYNFELAAIAAAMSNGDVITKMLERGYPAKTLLAVPLFHVSGCHSVFLLSLRANRPIVMMHKWDVEQALQLIEQERITTVYAVPTMLMGLLEADQWEQYDTSSLFAFGAGGSAQPPHLAGLIYQRLPDSFPGTGYGMTETSATGFASTGAAYAYKPHSCGTATPIVEVKIVNDLGAEVSQGDVGHIYLKSPGVVRAYWNKPEISRATFQDGWIKTGDIGYLDEEGFLFITDRSKDMVIRAGENISTAEVEAAVLAHPGIEEAAAFGLKHEKLGEELALAVVLKAKQQLSEQELIAYLGERLAQFKIPSKVFFTERLPRNATHKVIKSSLREQYS